MNNQLTNNDKDMARNYAQFFALLKLMKGDAEEDLVKKDLVLQYTNGRTDSLKAMSELEYRSMIGAMQRITTNREQLRKERSATLKLIQRLDVDTLDWSRVNSFCIDKRIAGKQFSKITIPEHKALQRKLRSMLGKRQREQAVAQASKVIPNLHNLPS